MRYVLMIHASEARFSRRSPAEGEAVMRAYGDYTKELFATGRAGDCAALEDTGTATTVRVRDGKRVVSDGPFAETREQLGGYYSLAGSEEDALAWAARIPDAEGGTIEVRPVIEMATPKQAVASAPGKDFLLLIYEAEGRWGTMSEAERNETLGRYLALGDDLRAQGKMVAGERLGPIAAAKAVSRVRGDRVVRDGPFAETREQLGGYYRVRARDLDEAIATAARIPAAETGSIEIRPVMDTSRYV